MKTDLLNSKSILQYLLQYPGRPTYIKDLDEVFGVTVPNDEQQILNLLEVMTAKGLIYNFQNAIYPTSYGVKLLKSPSSTSPYKATRSLHSSINVANRESQESKAKWNKYLKHFMIALEQFRANHPELTKLFDSLGAVVNNNLGDWHDATELAKDVQAIFNKWDFSAPELLYPNENYSVPEELESIEHAIAESLNRLKEHSPRHRNQFTDNSKYREIYDFAYNAFLQTASPVMTEFIKVLGVSGVKTGSFVVDATLTYNASQAFQSVLKDNYDVQDLRKTSIQGLLPLLKQSLRNYFKIIFFQEDSIQSITQTLESDLSLLKPFTNSKGAPLQEVGKVLFSTKNYDGQDLSGVGFDNMKVSSCSFIGSNLSATSWDDAKVSGCNFKGANFRGAQLENLKLFTGNNIEGVDFTGVEFPDTFDVKSNSGVPSSLTSNVGDLSKEEMKAKGFQGKYSFDHSYLRKSGNKAAYPYYTLGQKGLKWVRYIYASPDNPFPKELFDRFRLSHGGSGRMPGENALGWIGGMWDSENKILKVTEMQSDLLQRTFELSERWLTDGGYNKPSRTHEFITKGWTALKSKIENYFNGWQRVFINQAMREAKDRGAEFVYIPTTEFYKNTISNSPAQYYDYVANQYPNVVDGNWHIVDLRDPNVKIASKKLSWGISFGNSELPEEQVENMKLIKLFRELNIPFTQVNHPQSKYFDEPIEVVKVNLNGRKVYFGWDRGGYLVDYGSGESLLDGASLEEVRDFLVNKFKVASQSLSWKEAKTDNVPKPEELKAKMKEVSLGQDKDGYYVYTHRARSKSYKKPESIPDKDIKFISSTGSLKFGTLDVDNWVIYGKTYVDHLMKAQKEMTPSMTDREVARDAYRALLNDPHFSTIKDDPEFEIVVDAVKNYLSQKGFNNVEESDPINLRTTDEILNPIQNTEHEDDEGAIPVDPRGNPIEPDLVDEAPKSPTALESLKFDIGDSEDTKQDMINQYLEDLSKAKREGNNVRVEKIKRQLDELISLSSLRFI